MKTPKLLVACEESGVVRDAFAARGWNAWSCDLQPTDKPGQHIQGDVTPLLQENWDLVIAHPPCTFLTLSGVKHLYQEWTLEEKQAHLMKHGAPLTGHSDRIDEERWENMLDGAAFFNLFREAPQERMVIENPTMHGWGKRLVGGGATQFVQPYEFGHMESKRTGLRLYNMPKLVETNNVEAEMRKLPKKVWNRVHYMSPGPEREKMRSRTYPGIAQAMADQWGPYIENLVN